MHLTSFVRLCWAAIATLLVVCFLSSTATAAPAPAWKIQSFAAPTNFSPTDTGRCEASPESCDAYRITVTNVGSHPSNGSDVTLTDDLPPGLTVQRLAFAWSGLDAELSEAFCDTATVRCTSPLAVEPGQTLTMTVYVTVDPTAFGEIANAATVSGGGALQASVTGRNAIADTTPLFGPAGFSAYFAGLDGQPATQAAGRPYGLTTRVDLNNEIRETASGAIEATSVEDVRDLLIDLPPGMVTSARAAPTCTFAQLASSLGCPRQTEVGHIHTDPCCAAALESQIYNMVPEHGFAAEFGYVDALSGSHALYGEVVPSPSGYVLRTVSHELPQAAVTSLAVTLFGTPGERDGGAGGDAMFTSPADCSGRPLTTTLHVDSWQAPGTYNPDGSPDLSNPNWVSAESESLPVSGCNQLRFEPTLSAHLETAQADSPTGLEVDLAVPQVEGAATLATPPLKRAVVTLPEEMVINPSGANGLEGCSLAQIGFSASGEPDAAVPRCPDAAKIGSVELETPILSGVLEGQIYIARQDENPPGSLLAIYIVVDDPKTGIVVKLPAELRADSTTGRLRLVVDGAPQIPFSDLRAHFFGGSRAVLRTPALCGTYEIASELTPWSAPESGPSVAASAKFSITQGASGSPCPSSSGERPNKPSFSAGTVTPRAGSYSPFVLRLSRADGSQELRSLSLSLPKGLAGRLTGIPYCPDPALAAAAAGTGVAERRNPSCPPASQVGTVTIGVGAGPTPYYAAGRAYLAGPYGGAPLSLAIVTPALAGSFDLGTVVVRSALFVDPETARVTVRSDPIPTMLHGIPLDIRSIAVDLDRAKFILNPTNCEETSVTGAALSVLGLAATLSNSFQVGGCKALGFAPRLSLRFFGPTHRSAHPKLRATLTAPKGDAGIDRVAITLPGTELLDNSHIGDVCTSARFAAGRCPPGSLVGYAKAWTPLLDRSLKGPVYLRSSGHRLPSLAAALGGQIPLELSARVDSRRGRIRTTFETIPDAPLSKLRLMLLGGRRGLLVNSTELCRGTPRAGAAFVAQSGKSHRASPIARASCGKMAGARAGRIKLIKDIHVPPIAHR